MMVMAEPQFLLENFSKEITTSNMCKSFIYTKMQEFKSVIDESIYAGFRKWVFFSIYRNESYCFSLRK